MIRTLATLAITSLLAVGCTGGTESNAAEEKAPPRTAPAEQPKVDAKQVLDSISPAIPVYAGAEYRDDLTRRDAVMIENKYGKNAEVYTLATDDSFPQVYHYYTTYLAQFRAFPAQDTYPKENQNWRTLEVPLNEAMQDPFIPGDTLAADGKQVILQIAETEAEPKTVIRYIVTPPAAAAPAPVATASTAPPAAPVAR
ncbi:MAG TPA: hypothetical protein VFN10_07815 [Thermoanaerobaculia bacterium]|nr:hypothetical protein [Thermoanaerobaculia bacterium]